MPAPCRRPNTVPSARLITISSAALVAMTNDELIRFADEALGIAIPSDTKRTKILTMIVNAAETARDTCGW